MVPVRPFLIGSPGWRAVQRLDLAFLIDREHDGVVGCVDVEPDDLFELGRELRFVGQLEPANQMRPQAVSAPDPLPLEEQRDYEITCCETLYRPCWTQDKRQSGRPVLGRFERDRQRPTEHVV
jgi:hypothetical protein